MTCQPCAWWCKNIRWRKCTARSPWAPQRGKLSHRSRSSGAVWAKRASAGVYLHQYQLVPLGRSCEVLADLYNCHVSEATLVSWVQIASTSLEATVERIAQWPRVGRLLHRYETGLRVIGKRHWLHVTSTSFLTHLAWHPKRGKAALEVIGILPALSWAGHARSLDEL